MIVMGIDSSCDETAVSLVERKKNKKPFIINTSFGKLITFIIVIIYFFKIKIRDSGLTFNTIKKIIFCCKHRYLVIVFSR